MWVCCLCRLFRSCPSVPVRARLCPSVPVYDSCCVYATVRGFLLSVLGLLVGEN